MTDVAIKVENLSKRYRIGVAEERHDTLVKSMLASLSAPVRNFRRLRQLSKFESENGNGVDQGRRSNDQSSSSVLAPSTTHDIRPAATDDPSSSVLRPSSPDDTIWALKDVSFEVKRGEVVGVIGRNGAGKSTLLKILSRITRPTSGSVTLNGRVSSLLEVGTGFHPELTGRENIYLNGTILGMRKSEIDRKFDEIVDFSGVEKFIDTPVKRYSSGMRVRLAFSVAAHLEPEILLVDEVLAVGDAEFQKKCLGKMGEVAKEGRTVLFVSHNLHAVRQLCPKSMWLFNGNINCFRATNEVTSEYLNSTSRQQNVRTQISRLQTDEVLSLIDFYTRGISISEKVFDSAYPIHVELIYDLRKIVNGLRIGFDLCTIDRTILLRSFDDETRNVDRKLGVTVAQAIIPGNLLNSGEYVVSASIGIHNLRWIIFDELYVPFVIQSTENTVSRYAGSKYPGFFSLPIEWRTRKG